MGGWLQVHNYATSWSKLQVCKISGRAEIPKLGRVIQKLSIIICTGSNRFKNIQIQCESVHILEKNVLKQGEPVLNHKHLVQDGF